MKGTIGKLAAWPPSIFWERAIAGRQHLKHSDNYAVVEEIEICVHFIGTSLFKLTVGIPAQCRQYSAGFMRQQSCEASGDFSLHKPLTMPSVFFIWNRKWTT